MFCSSFVLFYSSFFLYLFASLDQRNICKFSLCCVFQLVHQSLRNIVITSSNQWLGSAGARLLRDARHRSLHGSTCRMDSNATKARSTLRRVAELLLILANEGQ